MVGFINDTTIRGVMDGLTMYVTGDTTLTYAFIVLLLVLIGFIFRLEAIIVILLMTPLLLLLMAYGLVTSIGMVGIFILGFVLFFIIVRVFLGNR